MGRRTSGGPTAIPTDATVDNHSGNMVQGKNYECCSVGRSGMMMMRAQATRLSQPRVQQHHSLTTRHVLKSNIERLNLSTDGQAPRFLDFKSLSPLRRAVALQYTHSASV